LKSSIKCRKSIIRRDEFLNNPQGERQFLRRARESARVVTGLDSGAVKSVAENRRQQHQPYPPAASDIGAT
jgi:hypothetical protein